MYSLKCMNLLGPLIFWPVEEQAFWTLVCAFDALGVEGYYTDRMLLLRADMQVLQAFMKLKCPKVAKVWAARAAGGCREGTQPHPRGLSVFFSLKRSFGFSELMVDPGLDWIDR